MTLRILLTITLACCCVLTPPAYSTTTPVWNGITTAWEFRLPGGFKTPHRMGTFASLITLPSSSSPAAAAAAAAAASEEVKGEVFMAYTPGVDGDYASPQTTLGVAQTPPSVAAGTHDVVLTWTDTAEGPADDPVATSAESTHLVLDLGKEMWAGGKGKGQGVRPGLVLAGFELDMHCNPALQPEGQVCNSNGIWASQMYLGIPPSSVEWDASTSTLEADVAFNLTRGWTPDKGGGKPFNYRMTFVVTIRVAYFVDNGSGEVAATPASSPVVAKGTLWEHEGGKGVATSLSGAGGDAFPSALVGIADWAFALSSKNSSQPGRYFESFEFALGSLVYTPSSGVASFEAHMDISAPYTVHDADVAYALTPVLLQFGSSSNTTGTLPVQATGHVCEDVKLFFKCADHHLAPRLNDTVPFVASLTP